MDTSRHLRKQLSGVSGLSLSSRTLQAALGRQRWIWPVVAALLLGGVGWWVHHSVERAMRDELSGQLTTILNADVEALRTWTRDQEAIARSLAQLPALRPAVRGLLAAPEPPGAPSGRLVPSRELAECRSLLNPYLKTFGYTEIGRAHV